MILPLTLALAFALPIPTPAVDAPAEVVVSREATAAHSARARDMRGPMPSLYRGRFFRATQERFRLCVGDREGSHTYMVRGGGGNNYYGTYQFNVAFQRGAAYMMANESRRTRDGLRREALRLRLVPINRWSRYWQDRAFFTVLNWEHDYSGRGHWAGGRWAC